VKKTIAIVLGMVVIATAINYCDPGGFDKDHEVAMQIATQIQKQCKNAHVCPVDIAKNLDRPGNRPFFYIGRIAKIV